MIIFKKLQIEKLFLIILFLGSTTVLSSSNCYTTMMNAVDQALEEYDANVEECTGLSYSSFCILEANAILDHDITEAYDEWEDCVD